MVNKMAKAVAAIPYAKMNVPQKLEYLKNLHGVQETIDVLKFLVSIAVAVKHSLADDGKITIGDAMNFMAPVTLFPAAIMGVSEVPMELTDEITNEEMSKLLAVVVESGVIPEAAQDVVEDALDLAENLKSFILTHFVKPNLA